MKLSEKWLREWVNPDIDTQQLAHQLTMAGLEVESVDTLGAVLNAVVVGQVLRVDKHPNADRLRVCEVMVSDQEPPLIIVCGADNVRAGLKVAVAQVGAELPGGLKIRQANIRGIESSGMICSAAEMNLNEESEGILELPENAPVGIHFSDYWGLPDHVLTIKLTPNRGDCLSIFGIARELSALNQLPLNSPEISITEPAFQETLPIHLESSRHCPRYSGRIIRDINTQSITPLWMQRRLEISGIRLVHPLVDIANYVMLELGQPMHVFDMKKIQGDITVRASHPKEEMILLNGQTLKFTELSALVIADSEKILALAGMMGGESSAVDEHTQDIFVESAFFTPQSIRPTQRRLLLNSEAGYRFERGVDPELPLLALNRFTELVLSIAGGNAGMIVEKVSQENLPESTVIVLRRDRIERLLGVSIPEIEVENILKNLGMQVMKHPQGWSVTPPSYRFDIEIETDLLEEIARIYGYDTIPTTSLQTQLTMLPVSEQKLSIKRVREFWVDKGYRETINYSFVDPALLHQINPEAVPLRLKNPISAEMAVMRTTLWAGLLQAIRYNLNRQLTHIRLFEIGTCFLGDLSEIQQKSKLAGVIAGDRFSEQWGINNQSVDFFDLKGDLELFFKLTEKQIKYQFIRAHHPALHPGRSAEIYKQNKKIGWVGELHPQLQQNLDLPIPIQLFELDLEQVILMALPVYEPFSRFPSVRRDLAFVISCEISYEQIMTQIKKIAGETLQTVRLFDIYHGQGIQTGKRSVGLGLTFQLSCRTLTDKEVDDVIEKIIETLRRDFQANLRG